MKYLKAKCDMRQKPKNLIFLSSDVDVAIEMLKNTSPTHALNLNEVLCEMCSEQRAFAGKQHNTGGEVDEKRQSKHARGSMGKRLMKT
mmetsp:Transcript_36160/g.35112  ORF Transcript_36160/g.35112 Transcript_36160/m.35112 type:complete len:88 (-) Transcript_36160:255-518(-)|eukprot:CAMPEP_0170557874 /NCGR_PEP_ID=MMETSP0211-20121228/30806_1 /TAXON_ID=311385 /ORGANISM="Pseudokeronopsis sp., Strain OXSARD2" /LENGTH=87 /DNA_ID=CAMNT_0010869277 /DNA_START=145 /DNA_END=408 /DNA_ORIENTATION=-